MGQGSKLWIIQFGNLIFQYFLIFDLQYVDVKSVNSLYILYAENRNFSNKEVA